MYYTYILLSDTTNQSYIGQTNNIEDRIHRHNTNRNKWTKGKGPWVLVWSQVFETRSKAMKLEKKLKGFKNKEYLAEWISNNKES